MNEFSFWNSWLKSYKVLLLMLLALLACSILYFIGAMWLGPELVIDWENLATLKELQIPLLQKDFGLLSLNLKADSYVVQQTFRGSELRINFWPAYLLLGIVALGLSMVLAVFTSLDRFWYIVGMGLFCALVVGLRLEQIQLFGRIDKTADILFFLLFLPLSYYFQAINTGVSLTIRFLSFLALFILLALLIYFFAGVDNPFLYMSNYGLPALMVVSFLLILLVAPEIIAGILYLVTASNTAGSQNSLMHFTIASLIYLGNLLLYYLQIRGVLDLGIYLISPFWIFLAGMVIAFWTLNSRSENFANILPYQPFGAFLYLALAVICLSTMGYVFATANDPLVETFEDAILYSHLGLGFFFFLYVLLNFYGLLKENKRVFWIVYKPRVMPLFSARLAGIIFIFALYSLHGMWAVYQPVGGYYNSIGDLYLADNNYFLAEQYYKQGSQYKYGNHRSNYALASLAIKAKKPVQGMLFLKEAIARQPTSYAYANLANLYFENNLFFDGLFTLREGIERYPREHRLYNNLGIQFGKTNVLDSALYYLSVAARDNDLEAAVLANEVALLASHRLQLEELGYPHKEDDIFYQTNLLALMNQNPALAEVPETVNPAALQDLGGVETAYLLNYSLLKNRPDSLLPLLLQARIDSTVVQFYEEPAGLALGILFYKQQNYYNAFRKVEDLASRSTFNRSVYYKLLGAWALEQGAPLLAAQFFSATAGPRDGEASLLQALALTEGGKPLQAGEVLVNLTDSLLNERLQKSKNEMLMLLGKQDYSDFPGNRSQAAYQALRLQWGKLDSAQENALLNQIMEPNLKGNALAWLVSCHLRYGSQTDAASYLQQLQQIPSDQLEESVTQMAAHLAVQYAILQSSAKKGKGSLAYKGTLGELMAAAREATAAGDTLKAIEHYQQVMQATPFLEEAYVLATPIFNTRDLETQAYDFILKAMLFNPYSVILREQYILQSLRLNMEKYALDELQNLKQMAEGERVEEFLQEFERVNQQHGSGSENW